MNASPAAIIEQIKYSFLSENFTLAVNALRDCFDEKDVSNKTILSFLKGEIGYSCNGNDIDFDVKHIDHEYTSEITDILSNYDFLIEVDNAKYQIVDYFDFDLSKLANTNEFIEELKLLENKLVNPSDLKYSYDIKRIMSKHGSYKFQYSDFVFMTNGKVFLFNLFESAVLKEIIKVYQPLEAINAYLNYINKY